MKKLKYVKVKTKKYLLGDMHTLIMRDTNSPLISLAIQRLCQKFVKDLEQIPLSEELQ